MLDKKLRKKMNKGTEKIFLYINGKKLSGSLTSIKRFSESLPLETYNLLESQIVKNLSETMSAFPNSRGL
jgi:hypothetical protein